MFRLFIIKDVNTDYIDANFTVDPAVICEASGDVLINDSLTQVDNDLYTYNWELNNINLDTLIIDSNSFDPTIFLPIPGLYDIKLEVISSTGCSDVLDSLEVVRVTGDTEFIVSKLNADSSEVHLPDSIDILLCNDDKIVLRNTSIHRLECPECFSWDLPGVNGLIVNDDEGTAIFDYSADESDQTWTLLYEDSTGICSDSDSKIKDVNTDYIDANFTVDPSVICEASEFVLIDDTLSQVDDDFYIFSWEIYNGLEIEYSAQDSLSPTFSYQVQDYMI